MKKTEREGYNNHWFCYENIGNNTVTIGFGSGREGVAGFRMMRNAWDCHHFHVFGSGWEGGDWLHNYTECMGLSTFSSFWNGQEGGRLASKSWEIQGLSWFSWFWKCPGGGLLARPITISHGKCIILLNISMVLLS